MSSFCPSLVPCLSLDAVRFSLSAFSCSFILQRHSFSCRLRPACVARLSAVRRPVHSVRDRRPRRPPRPCRRAVPCASAPRRSAVPDSEGRAVPSGLASPVRRPPLWPAPIQTRPRRARMTASELCQGRAVPVDRRRLWHDRAPVDVDCAAVIWCQRPAASPSARQEPPSRTAQTFEFECLFKSKLNFIFL